MIYNQGWKYTQLMYYMLISGNSFGFYRSFLIIKETKSATMNIFRFFFYFLFKSFVKVELNMFSQ